MSADQRRRIQGLLENKQQPGPAHGLPSLPHMLHLASSMTRMLRLSSSFTNSAPLVTLPACRTARRPSRLPHHSSPPPASRTSR
jgi:hypothetical protein